MSAGAETGNPSEQKKLMDSTYGLHRHFYDFTRKFYLLGRDTLIRELDVPKGGSVLEVGCGTARNLIVAAKRWPDARFYGFDISDAMLTQARSSLAKRGLSDKMMLAQADAGTFDVSQLFGLDKVDRIFMSYTISMIPPWQEAIERAAEQLAPGGSLHIVDFGQYERLPKLAKKLHFKSLNDFHVYPRRELPAVLKRVAEEHDMAMDFRALWRGYTWRATLTKA
ncbi:class I SAM-dependent methyltransferase [Stakelama tenebrarum]|uniref:Class I SAM-dependent methyltransferase n=1 Tax=Stakelama tenebrarum TaxID=2711215 RepID=A0A6G6Y1W3_9SPHN|nr:class I SAM-dependent methyltransferase [Sphingosinithalassobacter tenebrarum]QIG78934.1 class I SAM-dependent methyltransferase [Sphingosinithalassobacter tenebrarum]